MTKSTELHSTKPQHKHRSSDRYSSTTATKTQVANSVTELYAEGNGYRKTIRRFKNGNELVGRENTRKKKKKNNDNQKRGEETIPTNKFLNELNRYPALILNADYQPMSYLPLSVSHWQEAVKLIFSGKVAVVDVYEGVTIRAASIEVPLPSVIALNEYVPQCSHKPAFTRRNVFLRDEYTCQYCNDPFTTKDLSIDHVVPRSMGGVLNWENAVTSCLKCNGRKGSMLLSDLKSVGMRLQTKPRAPTRHELAIKAGRMLPHRKFHPTWQPYLGAVWGGNDDNTPTPDLEALGISFHEDGDTATTEPKPRKKVSKNKKKRVKRQQEKSSKAQKNLLDSRI
ncbi:HNH endonuclease [Seminavis robusta]|uniref:HNH endonuclease n=1 Tax=Seminavis robusta TaxID=568900 RepID=A0A9N8E6W4_9STRA|nr:HNH endonuclease [Seminavis robusta]|eukprot:Sro740_g195540.1 HNH endonuclease (339) ;mRNA; f:24470-25801